MRVYVTNGPQNGLHIGRKVGPCPGSQRRYVLGSVYASSQAVYPANTYRPRFQVRTQPSYGAGWQVCIKEEHAREASLPRGCCCSSVKQKKKMRIYDCNKNTTFGIGDGLVVTHKECVREGRLSPARLLLFLCARKKEHNS